MLAELSSIPHRNYHLVVSERSCDTHRRHPKTRLRFLLHRLADAIVTNSYAQKTFIDEVAPGLSSRTEVIHNCVQLDKYQIIPDRAFRHDNTIRIAVLGNFYDEKNPITFFHGFRAARGRTQQNMVVDWYGNNFYCNGTPSRFSTSFDQLQELISQFNLHDSFRTHPPVKDVLPVYAAATAFCLPSVVEAFPNAIGEAMACGLPVLASRVGDNDILVEDGVNGLLFDPHSATAISDALVKFAHLSPDQRHEMERHSRERAESLLSPERFADQYVKLLRRLSGDAAQAA
jgi:glycosyltransferase involved in cell wall biosynthesis